MMQHGYIRILSFLLMLFITGACFVISSCTGIPEPLDNIKSINKSDVKTLHDNKYILHIVINGDEKVSLDLIHYPKSDKLIQLGGSGDSYVFSVKNNQLEIISVHTHGFNSIKDVFLLNFNQNDGKMLVRNVEWNIDYEESAVPLTYSIEKCD